MYYFNPKTGKCKKFKYGGCDGNDNGFRTKKECKETCGHGKKDFCTLPSKTGPCRAEFPMYYFDPKTGKCKKFKYDGCDGNDNGFRTKKECKRACRKKVTLMEGIIVSLLSLGIYTYSFKGQKSE